MPVGPGGVAVAAGRLMMALLLAVPLGEAAAASPEAPSLVLERSGDLFTVRASAQVAARPEDVWQVLTDYDHIATFVPGITSSRVIAGAQPGVGGAESVATPSAAGGSTAGPATGPPAAPAATPDTVAAGERVLVVEQQGALGIRFISLDFRIDLRVAEHPLTRIDIERIAGSGRMYRASYLIEALAPGETRLVFQAQIESDRFVPPLIGTSLMRHTLSEQFDALVREIERRRALEFVSPVVPGK
jgi:hypothetical protein